MNPLSTLGANFPDFEGLFAIGLIFGIPIISILANHQRKMARIIHGQEGQNSPIVQQLVAEVQALRAELTHLRDHVNRQTLEADGLRQQLGQLATRPPVAAESEVSINQ